MAQVEESASNVGDLGSVPGLEDPVENRMATHSSILPWTIPWTEESGEAIVYGVTQSHTQLSD